MPSEAKSIGERVIGPALHERLVQLGAKRQPDLELDTGEQRDAALLLLGLVRARRLVELVAVQPPLLDQAALEALELDIGDQSPPTPQRAMRIRALVVQAGSLLTSTRRVDQPQLLQVDVVLGLGSQVLLGERVIHRQRVLGVLAASVMDLLLEPVVVIRSC